LAILSVYVSPSLPLAEEAVDERRARDTKAAGLPRVERRESISIEEDVRSISRMV
jgi:hypothetical protein